MASQNLKLNTCKYSFLLIASQWIETIDFSLSTEKIKSGNRVE